MAFRPEDETIMGLYTWVPTGESTSRCGAELSKAIDIIAVQGLGASPYYTWTRKVGVEEVMWLRDLLPKFVPQARIATFSYRSDWYTWKKGAKTSIRELGEQLLTALHGDRLGIKASRRPIVFIGHSMGGLVIQQALVLANNRPDYEDIRISTAGVIFLGTPHAGTNIAGYAKFLAVVKGNDPTLLKQLEPNKQELYDLSYDFAAGYKHLSITCFYEKMDQSYVGGNLQVPVVDQRSAVQVGREMMYLLASHSGLNKFSGDDDPNFKLVRDATTGMVDKASEREDMTLNPHNRRFMVWRHPNPLFTGRKYELDKLQKALCPSAVREKQNAGAKIYVLYGMGGAGKSEVALKFIYDHRLEFWGIFWIDARSENSIETGFMDISRRCGLHESSKSAVSWLQDTSQPWLLILDNADVPTINLSPYIPAGPHGSVLITSRLPACAQKYSNAGNDYYERLGEDTAVELLLTSCGTNSIPWSEFEDDAHLIVDLLGCHALAVVQAGAAVSQGICRLGEYKSFFLTQRHALLDFLPDLANSEYGNVYATFEVSARYLERCSDQAAKDALQLLNFHAFMHFSDFSEEIFQEAWKNSKDKKLVKSLGQPGNEKIYNLSSWHTSNFPPFMRQNFRTSELDIISLRTARAKLASLSLIHIDIPNGITRIHPVTHAWSRDRLKDLESASTWLSALAMLSLSSIPNSHSVHLLTYPLEPHLESMTKRPNYYDVYKDTFSVQQSVFRLACVFYHLQNHSAAYEMIQSIPVSTDDAWIETRNGQEIQLLRAKIAMKRRNFEDARVLLEQIGMQKIENLEPNDELQISIQNTIARLCTETKHDVSRGIEIQERLVELRTKKFGDAENRYVLYSLFRLAVAHRDAGDLPKAREILEHVVQTGSKVLKAEDPYQLASESHLAQVCLELGDTLEATRIIEHVAQTDWKLLKPDNPIRLCSEYTLACCYYESGKYEESLQLARSIKYLAQNLPGLPGSWLADRNSKLIRKCLKAKERGDLSHGSESPQGGGEEVEDEDEEQGLRRGHVRRWRKWWRGL